MDEVEWNVQLLIVSGPQCPCTTNKECEAFCYFRWELKRLHSVPTSPPNATIMEPMPYMQECVVRNLTQHVSILCNPVFLHGADIEDALSSEYPSSKEHSYERYHYRAVTAIRLHLTRNYTRTVESLSLWSGSTHSGFTPSDTHPARRYARSNTESNVAEEHDSRTHQGEPMQHEKKLHVVIPLTRRRLVTIPLQRSDRSYELEGPTSDNTKQQVQL